MADDQFRVSEFLRVDKTDDGFALKAREETGRGKRFGMDGEISLSHEEAERLAKWVFAQDLEDR